MVTVYTVYTTAESTKAMKQSWLIWFQCIQYLVHILPWETTVLKNEIFVAEGPTYQRNWTWACHQRPPVLWDHIFIANRVVFQERFYCITMITRITHRQMSLVVVGKMSEQVLGTDELEHSVSQEL